MTEDPHRLRDDPSLPEELRWLLKNAPKTEAMGEERRQRLAKQVALVGAVPVAASIPFAVKALALGITTAIGVGAITIAVIPDTVEPDRVPRGVATVHREAHEAAAEAPSSETAEGPDPSPSEPASIAVSAPEPTTDPARPRRARRPRRPAEPATDGPSALAQEIAILSRMQANVERNPPACIRAGREHRNRFPDGQLSAERELLVARALFEMGRDEAGVRRARQIRRRYPGSLAADRARMLLDEHP